MSFGFRWSFSYISRADLEIPISAATASCVRLPLAAFIFSPLVIVSPPLHLDTFCICRLIYHFETFCVNDFVLLLFDTLCVIFFFEVIIISVFSSTIQYLRKRERLTQEGLAEKLGITRPRLNNYEQGTREPDFEILELFADYFDVSLDYLFGRKDSDGFSSDEVKIISAYRQAPEAIQQSVCKLLDIPPAVLVESSSSVG